MSTETDQDSRTDFALDLRATASAVMADRVHSTPLAMHSALLLDVLARVVAREGGRLDSELAQRARDLADATQAEVNKRKTTPAENAAHAMSAFASTYTDTSTGYPRPEVVEDIDRAVLTLARHVTTCLSPLGAPHSYPVNTLARTVGVLADLVQDIAARTTAVAASVHGYGVLPAGVPGALRPKATRPDVDDVDDRIRQARHWLNYAADELADLVDPLSKAEAALGVLDHHRAPALDTNGATP